MGLELVGSFDMQISDMRLDVELELAVVDNRLTYDEVRTAFDCKTDLAGLPDWLLNPIFHYREKIREAVAKGVLAAFEDENARTAIGNGLHSALQVMLGLGMQIAYARIADGKLILGVFRTAQRAAA